VINFIEVIMKAVKIAGIRLVNYLNDGVNWKDHKDIILDFWIETVAPEMGYSVSVFDGMYNTDDLPTKALADYEKWFGGFDFQQSVNPQWIDFVDGTLNLFYKTSNPTILDDNIWYVELIQSEVKAKEIVEEQLFHGNPNLNSFWKQDTNTKTDEVGGRRNGYMFTTELGNLLPSDTKGYYWAVIFKCPETVRLYYKDGNNTSYKCINWAANAEHMTLCKVTSSGRLLMQQTFVPSKAWRVDRYVPQRNTPKHPLTGKAMNSWIGSHYKEMYGVWDEWEEATKQVKEAINSRKIAVATMNDEEVKLKRIVPDVEGFIVNGNVSHKRRERNKEIRVAIREKNKIRDREIKKRMREIKKEKNRQDRNDRNRMNPLISKT
jgi:hypothetical protein